MATSLHNVSTIASSAAINSSTTSHHDNKNNHTLPSPSSSTSMSSAKKPPMGSIGDERLLSVSVLPYRLLLAKLSREEYCVSQVLQLLFFPKHERFFSYTETSDDISVVLDEKSVAEFPSRALVMSPGVWKAIQIWEGPDAIDMPGIVSSFCAPLATAGVEMIYLSTFNTDLILVKEERVDEAYTHVKGSLAFLSAQVEAAARQRRQHEAAVAAGEIVDRKDNSSPPAAAPLTPVPSVIRSLHGSNDTIAPSSLDIISPKANGTPFASVTTPSSASTTAAVASPTGIASAAAINGLPSNDGDDDGETRMHLSPLSTKLALINFSKCHLPLCAHALLAIFLNPSRLEDENRFFSYTEAGDDVSLVLEKTSLSSFPSHVVQANTRTWRAIRISEGSAGFDPAGMVSSLSAELARQLISIYYLSTFDTDFTLVVDKEMSHAIQCLRTNLRVTVDEEEDQHT